MADIAHLKVGQNLYDIKDGDARTTASSAETKADQAIIDAAAAQLTANGASTSASNANTKIDGAKIVGTYTSATETLDIALELGSLNGGE